MPTSFFYKHAMPPASGSHFHRLFVGFIALHFIPDDAVTGRGVAPCRFRMIGAMYKSPEGLPAAGWDDL